MSQEKQDSGSSSHHDCQIQGIAAFLPGQETPYDKTDNGQHDFLRAPKRKNEGALDQKTLRMLAPDDEKDECRFWES